MTVDGDEVRCERGLAEMGWCCPMASCATYIYVEISESLAGQRSAKSPRFDDARARSMVAEISTILLALSLVPLLLLFSKQRLP